MLKDCLKKNIFLCKKMDSDGVNEYFDNSEQNYAQEKPITDKKYVIDLKKCDLIVVPKSFEIGSLGDKPVANDWKIVKRSNRILCTINKGIESKDSNNKLVKVDIDLPNPILANISVNHTPVKCPIANCKIIFGATSLLNHLLMDHNNDIWMKKINLKTLFNKQPNVIDLDVTNLKSNENVCIGCFMYGGLKENDATSRPAEHALCTYNSFLSQWDIQYKNHMPIMIMACLTSWYAWFKEETQKRFDWNKIDEDLQLLVIWLAGPEVLKPFNIILTLYNNIMLDSRSSLLKINPLGISQDPRKFLRTKFSCITLNKGELDILTENGTASIVIEVVPKEFPI